MLSFSQNNISADPHAAAPLPGRSMPRRSMLVALVAAACSGPASAELSDTVHPFAGLSYAYDSNLLRQPDSGGDPTAERADTSRTLQAGVAFERPLGRQVLSGSARATRVSFDHYDQLNYNGKELNGDLRWQLGNHLEGNLGGSYSQTLSPFSDFHSAERNVRVQRGEYAEAKWRVHPSWQLRGRLSRDEFDYELASQRYLNRNVNASELGLDYLVASGSTVGLQWRHANARYPNPLRFGAFVYDQSYDQDEAKLKVLWRFSEVTQLQFLGGRAKRAHTRLAGTDSSGSNGRLTVGWQASAKLATNAAVWKEYAPFEGGSVSYSQDKGASAGASWTVSAKLRADAQLRYVKREFVGATTAALPANAEDSTKTASLSLTYAPTRNSTVSASVLRDTRSTNSYFSSSYRSNGATLNANIQF